MSLIEIGQDVTQPGNLVITGLTYEEIASVIRTRFAALIETGQGIPVMFDNVKMRALKRGDRKRWIRFNIMWADAFQRDIGQSKGTRVPGIAQATIYGPLNVGDERHLEAADLVVATFKQLSFQGVTFRTPTVGAVGREKDSWFVIVKCPFFADNRI